MLKKQIRPNPDFKLLMDKVNKYLDKKRNKQLIEKAYQYIIEHEDDEKKINRSLAIALILTDIQVDEVCISATLLHDLVDTNHELLKEINDKFGDEIVIILEGLIKIGKINFNTTMAANVEYYKRILVGISEDVRVIVIMLAERLYEMRHLKVHSIKTQKIRAKETLDIFAPIAHRLGIYHFKSELEDLSLKYLKPDIYADIEAKLMMTKNEREETVNVMLNELTKLLNEHRIKHSIKGRVKSIYSIYKKLDKGRPFSDIYDIYALRIIVNTEQECYQVLGLIHSKYKPIPKRFKDMIAMPKLNMYQSIHTTVFGSNSVLYEIQIRTYEMDKIAEFGLAAHWAYKEKISPKNMSQSKIDIKLDLFRSIMDISQEKISDEEFINTVKEELTEKNIYIFTPKGDVIELPQYSTPIDFAYKIHTEIGEKMIGATVNDIIVPLGHKLKNGDIVKIITNKNSSGPSKEWINLAKSSQTKSKIRAYFARLDRHDYIIKGKELLEKELRRRKLAFKEVFADNNINDILTKLKMANLDDLYYSVGFNNNPQLIVNTIIRDTNIESIAYKDKSDLYKLQNTKDLIVVEGIDAIKINLAKCCMPIIGDEIVGYITKGSGITVHKVNCHNIKDIEERKIEVFWNKNVEQKLPTGIVIETTNRDKTIVDIASIAGPLNISIDSINTKYKNPIIVYDIIVLVENVDVLNKFIAEVNKLSYIIDINRKI